MFQPLPNPIPPEIAADLSDPGSPPEGYIRVAVLRSGGGDKFVEATRPGLPQRVAEFFSEPGDTAEFAVAFVPEIVIDMLEDLS